MTTNQDRALETMIAARYAKWPVEELPEGHDERTVKAHQGLVKELYDLTVEEYTVLAQALADAGLLAPDLPEPEDIDRFPGSKCWQLSPYRSPRPSSHVAVRLTHDGLIKVNLTGELDSPLQLREAAAALLAAAAHTNQEKK